MANTKSGAISTLEIAEPAVSPAWVALSGSDSGLGDISMPAASGTEATTSGGLTTTEKTGHITRSLSFSIKETAASNQWFLGRYGHRYMFRYRKQGAKAGTKQFVFEAIVVPTRTLAPAGSGSFAIAATVDGMVNETTQ